MGAFESMSNSAKSEHNWLWSLGRSDECGKGQTNCTEVGYKIRDERERLEKEQERERAIKNAYLNSVVPKNTIKKGYDPYRVSNFNSPLSYGDGLGTCSDKEAMKCGKTWTSVNKVFTLDNKWHKGEHRCVSCGGTSITPFCFDCDFQGSSHPANSVKVPIGSEVIVSGGNITTNTRVEGTGANQVNCWGPPNQTDLKWGRGNFKDWTEQPEKMPDEVATGCAGGYNLGRDQFVKTLNGFKIHNDAENKNFKSDDCFLGASKFKTPGNTACLYGGIDKNSFCQMGDYIVSESVCKNECDKFKEGEVPNDKRYCDYGYERLCEKRIGDPIKRDDNGEIVYATKDYLKSEPDCMTYCGISASSPQCKKIKNNVCTRRISDWADPESWIPNYCRAHWQKNPDRNAMDKICRAEMLKEDGEQNVWSGKGCGRLCMGEGTDADTDWCKTIKAEYCRKNDNNMLTDDCFDFCAAYPDMCDDYLSGVGGMCNRLGITTADDLDKDVEGTLHKYSDWCGCMMPRGFYNEYADGINKQFQSQGYDILSQVDTKPECMYPKCKQGSIMTNAQNTRMVNKMCTDCVQIMLQSYDGSFIDNNFASEQSASCGKIKQQLLFPGIYNVKKINKYVRVFDDKSYCVYPDDTAREQDKANHSFTEINNVDEIAPDNFSSGRCQLLPGFYKVTSIDRIINVHEGSRKYCIFPEDYTPRGLITEINNIPIMNPIDDNRECVPDYITDTIRDFVTSIGIDTEGLGDSDLSTYFWSVIGGIIFIIIFIIVLSIILSRKTN